MIAVSLVAAVGLFACGVGVGLWLSHTPSRVEPQAITPTLILPLQSTQLS